MSRALELTTSAHEPLWEDAYEELAYTAFALGTQAGDAAIAPLFTEVRGVLADWERIELDRRSLRGVAIASRAHVRVADAALDVMLGKIAEAVLEETGGDRSDALYTRFFPQPHEQVIALGLDGELPVAGVCMAQLDAAKEEGGEAVSDAIAAHAEQLRACLTVGNQALSARADAYADLGRLEARVEAWLEGASAVARHVHHTLSELGEARGLGYRWTATFFVSGTVLV